MYRIGQILEEEDQARAEEWYRRAADAKDNDAMLRLGQLSEGRSRAEAAMWYRRAADRGSEKARMALKRIYPWRYFISIKYRRRHRRRRTSHWR
jgi:TPR repeat protein